VQVAPPGSGSLACPATEPDPGGATCTGPAGADNFYGHGLDDAYKAVTM